MNDKRYIEIQSVKTQHTLGTFDQFKRAQCTDEFKGVLECLSFEGLLGQVFTEKLRDFCLLLLAVNGRQERSPSQQRIPADE